MKTYATKGTDIRRRWYLVDAQGQVLGRLASDVASLLMGKWKRHVCSYLDVGDHVVVTNAEKVRLTGKKLRKRAYFHHTGYLGSGRFVHLSTLMQRDPAEVVRDAVWGMVPHNRLGRMMIRKLKVYRGPEHPHAAQRPIPFSIGLSGKSFPGQEEGE